MDPRAAIALGGALAGACASQWWQRESAGFISAVTVQPKAPERSSGGKGTISLVGAGPGV